MTAKKSGKKKAKVPTAAEYRFVEGTVDPSQEHIGLTHGDDDTIIARVARGEGHTFIVQYLIGPDLVKGDENPFAMLQKELTFYMIQHGPQSVFGDPWKYAKYHCGTAANLYSSIHWGWYPDKSVRTEEKQYHAMNKKKVYICPRCDTKFMVTGNVPFTCPECNKAELVPLTMSQAKQVERIDVEYCPICHSGVPGVDKIVPGNCFHQCASCKTVSIGKPGMNACPYCGHTDLVESYNAWPIEKVCQQCRDSGSELIENVEKGGVYFVCTNCGVHSVAMKSSWTKQLRKDMGRKATGWAQVNITYCQCPRCNPLGINGVYTVKKGELVFKGVPADRYRVVHGRVAKNAEHVLVSHDDINKKGKRVPLARLAPGNGKEINIQYLVSGSPELDTETVILGEVKLAIERVAQFKKTNPWPQMKKLGSAKTGLQSKIHWEYQKAVVK